MGVRRCLTQHGLAGTWRLPFGVLFGQRGWFEQFPTTIDSDPNIGSSVLTEVVGRDYRKSRCTGRSERLRPTDLNDGDW